MSNAEDFMLEAKQAVAARTKTISHKAKTMVWYAARDALRHAPVMALTKVGAAIPFPGVGAAVNFAIDKAVQKMNTERKKNKRARYAAAADAGDLESLRKAAKADAKDQKTLSEKIDGNLVKLKDSAIAANASVDAFLMSARGSPTKMPTKDAAWALACALYDVQHYEDKLHVLLETMKERMTAIEAYVNASRAKTTALEEDLTKTLDDMEKNGADIASESQGAPSAPGAYARLGR